jgi:hypothetical protein
MLGIASNQITKCDISRAEIFDKGIRLLLGARRLLVRPGGLKPLWRHLVRCAPGGMHAPDGVTGDCPTEALAAELVPQ